MSTPSEMTDPSAEAESVMCAWDARIRLLANVHLWVDAGIAFGAGSVLVAILFLVVSKSASALVLGAGLFAFIMGIYLLIAIIADLCGGFRVSFALTNRGVRSIAGKGAGRAAAAAFRVGLLAGKPGVAGAGILAKSEQSAFIPYRWITKVRPSPRDRTILVRSKRLDKPIRLYCTADNFAQVLATLREHVPKSPR